MSQGDSRSARGSSAPRQPDTDPKPSRESGLRDLFSPESKLRTSTWDAPPSRFQAVSSPDAIPESVVTRTGDAWLVANFELAERLVSRGAESSRIGVDRRGAPQLWIRSLEHAGPLAPLVPPEPFEFPWRSLVIVPTYNESDNLERMVGAILRHLSCEILVVDDDSPDGTGRIADELSERHESVHVLHRTEKAGLGRAYIAGFRWALERGFERIYEMDCDFSHPPWDLPRMTAASEDADLVIGSRYVTGGSTEGWVLRRRLLSRGANLYTRLFLGFSVNDWTAGFRCYSSDLLSSLDLDSIAANGYSFQIEMTWRSLRQGARVREIPIHFVDRTVGTSKMDLSIALEALRVVPWLRLSQRVRRPEKSS